MAYQTSFEAIGTWWVIDIFKTLTSAEEQRITRAIRDRIELFDRTYSRFRKDSVVTAMAKAPGIYTLPDDAAPLLELYQEFYALTDGAMTPLIGNTLSDAGYDATYSLVPKTLTHPPAWDDVLSFQAPQLRMKQKALLDVGALGKGYLVDIIGSLLENHHVLSYCIDAGGDMLYKTTNGQPLRVGLENPSNTKQVIGVATIQNQSICGSAGNRRQWGAYHHIINPHTLTSPQHLLAVWVVAPTVMLADGLTTALFFTSPQKLLTHYTFSYLLLLPDYTIEKSADFPAELYYS